MDLKNTINNTNTHKENIKTVATQIDNKLVELGGEQATDLSDVANKMGAMTEQYLQYASINTSIRVPKYIQIPSSGKEHIMFSSEIVKNLNFDSKIEKLFVNARIYTNSGNSKYDKTVAKILKTTGDSITVSFPYYPDEYLYVYVRIKKISNEKSLFEISGKYYSPDGIYNPDYKTTVNLSPIGIGFLECYSKDVQ